MANKKNDPSADTSQGVFGTMKNKVARKDKDEQGDGSQNDPSADTSQGVFGRMKNKVARKDKDEQGDGSQNDPSADIGVGVFGKMKNNFAKKDKDEHGDASQKDPSAETGRGVFGKWKDQFARKDKDVHRDGIKRVRCPGGITEKDVDTYFNTWIKDYELAVTETDKELHVQAQELLRTHDPKTFQNAELTIVGCVVAVRFFAGKGRQKFRLEPPGQKTPVQVHIENLLFGFIRLVIFVAAMLEAISSIMSIVSLAKHDSDKDDENPMSVTFFMNSGDVCRGLVGLLAAIETINSSISPFSSAYGIGPGQGGKTHGVGVWPLGPRRWLFRGLLYACVACRGRLHVLRDADFLLPVDTLYSGQLYSGWILTGAALISVCLHLLHVPFPSLLKTPWTSITLPSHSSQDALPSVSADIGKSSTETVTRIEIGVERRDAMPGQEHRADGVAADLGGRCCRCCPKLWPVTCRRRPCTVNIWLQSVGVFLCLATAVVLFSCHVTRLVHSVGHQSTVPSVQSLSPIIAALLLCAVVGVCQAIGFFQAIMTHPSSVPLTVQTSLLLHAAAVCTTWSRDVVAWLTETCGWSEEAVGAALVSGSVMSLLFPALLRLGAVILAWRRQPRHRLCVSCNLRERPRELVLRGMYKVAVLLAVSGMIFAVISLPLPIARIQTEYTGEMLEAVQHITRIKDKAHRHYEKLESLLDVNLCGISDVKQVILDMNNTKQAAASLTVAELKSHCDGMSWKTIVTTNDVYCKDYSAAKLFLDGSMSFNKSFHEPKLMSMKNASKEDRDEYLNKVIDRSRGEQLKELDISELDLTPGPYKVRETCLKYLCIAKHVAFVAMLVPFFGIISQVAYATLSMVISLIRLIIKLSKTRNIFLELKATLEILAAKFLYYKEEKNVQFSLSNFNLIYLAYPALLTGCAVVLMGFWYRKGAPLTQRRRATTIMMLPLLFLNLFGLGVSFAWTHVVMILGEVAPMVDMTVKTLSALVLLRISYGLTLTALVLFLVLGFAEGIHVKAARKAASNNDSRLAMKGIESDSVDELSTLTTDEKVKPKKKDVKKKGKGVKITRGVESRGSVWVLALVISAASAVLMTIIMWKPIFAFDCDLNADMKSFLKGTIKSLEANAAAKLAIYDKDGGRCSLTDMFAKYLIDGYMRALKKMVLSSYQQLLNSVTVNAKLVAVPSMHLIQIPLLLTSYMPLLAIAWSLLMTKIRPSWAPPPRTISRLVNTMAWLSIAWLTSGVLFLKALAEGEVLPMFHFQMNLGPGFPYVMASAVLTVLSSQELRLAARSPIL